MQHHTFASTGQMIAKETQLQKQPSDLDMLLGEMDNQLSRFFNAKNRLEQLAQRLKSPELPDKITTDQPPPPVPMDHCGKFYFHNGTFNRLNNELESIVEYLQKIV